MFGHFRIATLVLPQPEEAEVRQFTDPAAVNHAVCTRQLPVELQRTFVNELQAL